MTIPALRFRASASRLIRHYGEDREFQLYTVVQDKRLAQKISTATDTRVTAKATIEEFSKERQATVSKTRQLLHVDAAPFDELQLRLSENWRMLLPENRSVQVGSAIRSDSDQGSYFEIEVDYGQKS